MQGRKAGQEGSKHYRREGLRQDYPHDVKQYLQGAKKRVVFGGLKFCLVYCIHLKELQTVILQDGRLLLNKVCPFH